MYVSIMDTRSIVAISAIGCIVFYVTAVILYMKLAGGQFATKLKTLLGLVETSNQSLTRIYIAKKYLYLLLIVCLNIGFTAFVYFVTSYRIVMYLVLFLKSKDIITTTIWLFSLIRSACITQRSDHGPINNQNIVSIIPAYSETYDQIIRTLNSIVDNEIGQNRNLLFIVCDGKENGLEKAINLIKKDTVPYRSWKLINNSLTLMYGYYRGTPCVIIQKNLNQGKKDSLILSHDIFNYPRSTVSSSELRDRVRTELTNLYGLIDFGYMFCTDADSIITSNSFANLLETIEYRQAHACCGLVVVDFAESKWSPWNLYQNFQYLYGQYVRRGCENLMGSVMCMPGCITMFKICPVAAEAIKMYSTLPDQNDLIQNSVQMLGTDRRLAASFLYQSSKVKHVMDYRAKCYTIPPNTLYQYISQRRRWGSNMYFNTLCNMLGPNINWFIRFLCFLDVTRVSLSYFRIFNIILFIYSLITHLSTDFKLYLPFIITIVYPITSFFIYCLCDRFLRVMFVKIVIGYILNKVCSLLIMIMIVSNMFWNVGSTAWGGVIHKSSPPKPDSDSASVVIQIDDPNHDHDHPNQPTTDQIDPHYNQIDPNYYDQIDPNYDQTITVASTSPNASASNITFPTPPLPPPLPPPLMVRSPALTSVPESVSLRMIPLDARTKKVCRRAVRHNGRSLVDVPPPLIDRHLCHVAMRHHGLLKDVPSRLRSASICWIAVKHNTDTLKDVPMELRDDLLCQRAIKYEGMALKDVPPELKTESLCVKAIKTSGGAYFSVPDRLKTKRRIIHMAVRRYGCALYDVPEHRKTKHLCEVAVRNNGVALYAVPPQWRTPALIELANQQDCQSKLTIR